MKNFFLKYLLLFLILGIIYNLIPKNIINTNIITSNIYLFFALGLLIFLIFNNNILPILSEYYTDINKYDELEDFETSVASTSVASTSVASTPVASTSVASTSVASTPVASTPILLTPVASTPVASTPVASTPVASIPVASTPVASTPILSTPVASTPVASTVLNCNTNTILTDAEIVYYVNLFNTNLNNTQQMYAINNNLRSILALDICRGTLLLKLLNLVKINPIMSVKVANTVPFKLIDIINAMDSADFNNLIIDGSSKTIELDLIRDLQSKISMLEQQINTNIGSNKAVPQAIQELLAKGKYIDDKGVIQNLLYGDMKYNTLNPEQMEPLGSNNASFSNKWDNAFTILNTDKWKPPTSKVPVCKQETKCPVCPTLTSGYPLSVYDFDKSRYIMGPDNISVDYIKQLNNPIKS